jgi:hypothetical protein
MPRYFGISVTKSAFGVPDLKIFVTGKNTAGTTSIARALRGLGYRLGNLSQAEHFIEDWGLRDFRGIIRFCDTADA